MITFDTSALLGYYQARTGQVNGAPTAATSSGRSKAVVPTAPWVGGSAEPSTLVKAALNGRKFVDEEGNATSLKGASGDYKKLFATYQALNTLSAIAARASEKGVSDGEIKRLQTALTKGLSEVTSYTQNLSLDQGRLTPGSVMTTARSTVGVPKNVFGYITDTIYSGQSDDPVPKFQGNVSFDLAVRKFGVTTNLTMDLAEMGATPRTMSNVVSFMNGKLKAGGFETSFAVERKVGETRTVQVNGQPVTLPATGDDFALRVRGDSSEQLTFTATAATPAVYITTAAGNPDPDKDTKTEDAVIENTLTKYSAAGGGQAGGKVFSETLQGTISSVRKTVSGSDGSIYMLADVTKDVSGQVIKGDQDVALLKYDSAGHLLYARSLGATDSASGLNLAVASDGSVAVAGSVTGRLQGAVDGPINSDATSGKTDSFVTRYDASGDEQWTVRRGAMLEDEATAVAFGSDGILYVGGRSKSDLPASTTATGGGYDSYLTAFATDLNGGPKALFTEKFGTTENDSVSDIVVNGSQVVVGGKENGNAVLRSFTVAPTVVTENASSMTSAGVTVTTPVTYTKAAALTAGAVRDLGSLKGGELVGLKIDGGQLYVGGHTSNGALSLANTTSGASGGSDGFVGRLSLDLSDTSADTLAYYGGTGDDTVTGMAIANGSAWLVGAAGKNLEGQSTVGEKDGYVAQIDVGTGAVSWSQRLTGKDGYAMPTSIAVDQAGSSSLDAFGLPKGKMDFTQSERLVSATAARAGDTFQIRTRERGTLTTITIDAKDTLETLADKIKRASGFRAKVETSSDGNARKLKISPAYATSTIEVLAGKGGTDVLQALGLSAGVVRSTKTESGKTVSADGGGPVFGLQLPPELDLADEAGRKNASSVITRAMSAVRTAYREIADNALGINNSATNTAGKTGGTVPAYLKNQISNYQAALNRLTG
ncbi:hypothetical protein [Caulobacter henricii]|uniref:Uncharacterized protein n=1 Tax=Caulobacter henricii TaxID=69395 RepID=A0A0P0NZJ9_9CAUL|nr:hypothetical protein [Caulobacter henricii]ALL13574.1 hypothetical protein AQ619_09540 [Caulobacter henricii]